MRPGDTLVVASLDRLSRSLQDLIAMVAELRRRQVGFRSLHEQLDATTPGGRLVFHVFAALAEFIRELIVEGTREGPDAARARGRVGGRPPVMTPEKIAAAQSLLPEHQHLGHRLDGRRQPRHPLRPHGRHHRWQEPNERRGTGGQPDPHSPQALVIAPKLPVPPQWSVAKVISDSCAPDTAPLSGPATIPDPAPHATAAARSHHPPNALPT